MSFDSVNLHIHTNRSDGLLAPYEIAEYAAKNNVGLVAVTDHDETGGINEAVAAAAGTGVVVLPGVELSAEFGEETHVLGYGIDAEQSELGKMLAELRGRRDLRVRKMLGKLRDMGIDLPEDEVFASGESAIGRPHIARMLVARGYAESVEDAFERYIGNDGPAYVKRKTLSVGECIELIAGAGGIAVLAHPHTIGIDNVALEQLLIELKGKGLWGMECHYPTFEDRGYVSMAKRLGLFVTGGTDCHSREIIGLGTRSHAGLAEGIEALKARLPQFFKGK